MRVRASNKAMTRMQGVLIIVILVVVTTLGFYYYPTPHTTKKLVIDFWYSAHWPQTEDQAIMYKTQLERTGLIQVNLHSADWASYKKNRDAEMMPVYIGGWRPDYLDPDNYIYPFLHSQGGEWLHMNYENPEVDQLIEQARAASDPATRYSLYEGVQRMMVDDAPFVPVWQGTDWAVTKPDLRGVALDMLGYMHYSLIESPREMLVVGTTDSVQTNVDPAEAYEVVGLNVIMNLGAGLVRIKPGSAAAPQDFMPELATSWSSSSDGLTWTFDLRKGVKFCDGTEFNATHVKYSFDRSMALYLPDGAQAAIGYKDIIDRIEIHSPYRVVFRLKIPFAPFLSLMAFPGSFIVNPKLAPMDRVAEYVDGDARASSPNDLGPYVLTSWIRKAGKDYEMRYDANPNYWGIADGYPKVRHIVFRLYSDETALALAMKSGDIDMAYRKLTAADIRDFQTDPTVKVWQGKGAFIQYICFQEKILPFDNPNVRQAIAAALNREELVETVFLGQAEPLYSVIPNGMIFHQDAFKALGDGNVSFAISTLRELGYG